MFIMGTPTLPWWCSMNRLRVVRRRRSIPEFRKIPAKVHALPTIDMMSLGDVLYRLSLVSPDRYRALDKLARISFKELWPHDTDILALKEFQGVVRHR